MKRDVIRRVASRWTQRTLKGFNQLARTALFSIVILLCSTGALESAPPAGTSIGNQASATYTDASNTPRSTTSNIAITIVQQVASFTLTADGAKFAAAGSQVYYPHTLVNTGNASSVDPS